MCLTGPGKSLRADGGVRISLKILSCRSVKKILGGYMGAFQILEDPPEDDAGRDGGV